MSLPLVYSLSGVRRAASSGRTDHQLSWRVRGATLFWCRGRTGYHDVWVVKMPWLPQYLGYPEASYDDQMTILPAIFRKLVVIQDVRFFENVLMSTGPRHVPCCRWST